MPLKMKITLSIITLVNLHGYFMVRLEAPTIFKYLSSKMNFTWHVM